MDRLARILEAMTSADIDQLLTNVSEAAHDVRGSMTYQGDRSDMLNRFWWLQDNLNRLVEVVSDQREDALPILRTLHSDLPNRISDLMHTVSTSKTDSIAAVASSCSAINRSLLAIESVSRQNDPAPARQAATAGR